MTTTCARCGRPATYPANGTITCVCGNRIHGTTTGAHA